MNMGTCTPSLLATNTCTQVEDNQHPMLTSTSPARLASSADTWQSNIATKAKLQTMIAGAACTAANQRYFLQTANLTTTLPHLLDFIVSWVVWHFELCGPEQLRRCAGSSQVNAVRCTWLNKACGSNDTGTWSM
jgi:hypothetical protein